MAELLRMRCPTGKCNYTLLAAEAELHCPISLRGDSGWRPLLTSNIKHRDVAQALQYLRILYHILTLIFILSAFRSGG